MADPFDLASIDPLDPLPLERCARALALDRLVDTWTPRLAGARDPRSAARRAVLRAIRLDLPLLVSEPELLFERLYNRLYWHDSAEADAFYGLTKSARPAGYQPPLRAWVERWRDDRRARGEARRWARSLRPPEIPLYSPLLEEYRDAPSASGALRFSPDGAAIGILRAGDVASSIAWDRRSGTRLDAAAIARAFPPIPEPRFALERARGEPQWGRCRVRDRSRDAIVADLDLDGDSSLGEIAALPGGDSFFVAGWRGDYDGVIFRVDPPYKAARWCAEPWSSVDALAPSADGRLLAATDRRRVYLFNAATGVQLAVIPLAAGAIALDPGGALLTTLDSGVLRVWDVAALASQDVVTLKAVSSGWIDAQFSPDGRRLLTGELLCDAEDGHIVASLDLDGPGYLEGGPPRDGRRLANRRYVEMAPMRGVCVWDARWGNRTIQDQERHYSGRDVIVIAPDGFSYAHTRERFASSESIEGIRLLRTDDGAVLAELAIPAPEHILFSPDGARLVAASEAGEIVVWSAPDGRELLRVAGHRGPILDLRVAHDGASILSAGRDGVLRLWDAKSGSLRGERRFHEATGEGARPGSEADAALHRAKHEALQSIEGWLGFFESALPFTTRHRGAFLEILEREGCQVHARVVTPLDLVAGPGGRRWARRAVHVAIEEH